MRAGTANVFVRFAGCNLRCDVEPSEFSPGGWRCDTDFSGGRPYTRRALLEACRTLAPACRWLIFTGGEPALQLDQALVAACHGEGYHLALETNGTVNVDALGLDWVCVSPKTAEHTLRQLRADEVKYVRHAGQALPRTRVTAAHYLVSPAFEADGTVARATLAWCIQLCKEEPLWRLSMQQHKIWNIR